MLKWTGGVAYTTPHEDEKEGWRVASQQVQSRYPRARPAPPEVHISDIFALTLV